MLAGMQFPERTVLVCANQRSGSTMLSRALRDTGLVGTPEEYFLSVDEQALPDFPTWERGPHGQPGMTRDEYLASVYQHGTSANGVFSAKVQWICIEWMLLKFRELPAFADLSDIEVLNAAFGRLQVIQLTRRDRVAQAVSWARADQEGVWVVSDDEPATPTGTPRYDPELIGNLVQLVEHGETQWRSFFKQLGVVPVQAVYEDLVTDLGGEVTRIVNELGLGDVEPSTVSPSTHRQADALNDEWIARFRAE